MYPRNVLMKLRHEPGFDACLVDFSNLFISCICSWDGKNISYPV